MMVLSLVTRYLAGGLVGLTMAVVPAAAPSVPAASDLELSGMDLTLADNVHRTNILTQATTLGIQLQNPIVVFRPPDRPAKKFVVASTQASKKPAPEPPADIDAYLHRYAGEFNLDAGLLHRIANCESHFNPGSVSGTGAYGGMFQFSASTWKSTRNAMGLDPNPDLRFNAEEAIRTAAFKISHGGLGAWPVCGKR